MKPKLAINGAAGRMGRRILAMAIESANFEIVGAVDYQGCPDIGTDAGILAGKSAIGVKLSSEFTSKSDVVIDFSLPQAFQNCLDYCLKVKSALVVGTTGLDKQQLDKIDSATAEIPVIQATNMSIGMNMLFKLVGKVAETLGEDYDIEITEAHHRFKKDSPSGSALSLAESIAKSTKQDYPDCIVNGRQGKDCLRQKGTIGMHAIRCGDIVGQHTVYYSTLGETITISHNAHSRDTFAAGAVRAAKWLCGREPKRYTMADVLGL